MRRIGVFLALALLPAAWLSVRALEVSGKEQTAPSSEQAAQGGVRTFDRFDGTITIKTREGKPRVLRVVMRNRIIDNYQTIRKLGEDGFMIVQLRAGELTATLGGRTFEPREDEFWTVPEAEPMSLETGKDSATIQTVTVSVVRAGGS